ncbi:unnamed protein product [Ectocarpus sp. 4 AP-2014]
MRHSGPCVRSSAGRPPLAHNRNVCLGRERRDARAAPRETELDPVVAELRGLKADIYTLNRSLDGSTITFAMGKGDLEMSKTTAKASLRTDLERLGLSATPHPSSPYVRMGRTEVQDHRHPRAQGGPDHDLGHSSGGESDCKLEIRFPPPPPSQQCHSRASGFGSVAAAAASCSSGVRRDYGGGVKDVGQLVRRVEASTRAVSREKEHIAKILRIEKEKTARLREALWQEGGTKREWEMLTQASSLLKQRLESTERIRNRQKELIRELQAVEADIAFANAGNMAGLVSMDPLPNLSPPLPPPPPPSSALPPTARRRKASSSSLLAHRRGNDTERDHPVDERCGRRSGGSASDRARTPLRGKNGEQRRPPPTGTKSAKSDYFPAGRTAAMELEAGGGGGGTRLGRSVASASVRTVSRAAAVRPERPRRSGGPADGATKSGISATGARKSSEGAVASKAKSTQAGRTRSGIIDPSSADTKARAEVDRKSKSATTATAQSRHRAATSATPAAAPSRNRVLRRQASTKAKVRSGATFGAPTAASAGKIRITPRRAVASSGSRVGATKRAGDGFISSSRASACRPGKKKTSSCGGGRLLLEATTTALAHERH